jgi:23S rRNA pseudouridine1911/1915/1917 synthase
MVYEDDALIVVEKKNGLLTVPVNQKSSETTVFSILKEYVKKQSYRNTVHVVHRLDRETSGLLVFAKSPELQEYMRTYWRQLVTKRTYVALVEGKLEKKEGKITSWLTENPRTALVSSSPVDNGGQLAITNYKVLRESNLQTDEMDLGAAYSLVELNLETGRTNQIRVHMASMGHPVVGDRKYGNGNESSPIDRLCLHARVLEFIHPMTEKKVRFEAAMPKEFTRVIK